MHGISSRPFSDAADIDRISQFLLDTYALNDGLNNWEPRRWIGRVYHNDDADKAAYLARLPQIVRLWEDVDANILGVVIPEYDGGIFLQVHPRYREIEAEMLDWAESTHMQAADDGRWLDVWAFAHDERRNALLKRRGYTRSDAHEVLRRCDVMQPIPDVATAAGYRVRKMRRDDADCQQMADLLNAAFQRDFHNAEEYRNFQTSPFYRPDFDLVAETSEQQIVATAGFTVHERESFAMLEPVATHPNHQGKGLARALIAEGLQRAQAMGIKAAFVNTWFDNAAANRVYARMGFTQTTHQHIWKLVK